MTTVLLEEPEEDRSWSGSRSAKSTYSRLTIFCMSFCGKAGVPGKVASGLVIKLDAAEVMVVDGTVVRAVVSAVGDGLEMIGGRRREPAGSEENEGKPSADTSGGGGGNPSVPVMVRKYMLMGWYAWGIK